MDPIIADTVCFDRPDDAELLADVFYPSDPARRLGAAIILVHGGGWNAGSRQGFVWHARDLAEHGYLACTIDYRLAPTSIFPAALDDCRGAVAWVRRNAERFGVNPDRVGVIGSSAGAHLAACLGVTDEPREDLSTKADRVVAIHGVHDFVWQAAGGGGVREGWQAFLGGPREARRERWEAASPAWQVDASSAPMLVTHDPDDTVVPYEHSVRLANALIRAGREVWFMPTPGSGHGFVYSPSHPWTRKIWPHVVDWLDRGWR